MFDALLIVSFGGPEGMALIDMISKITDEVTILTSHPQRTAVSFG